MLAVGYCLLFAYCLLWVPWCVTRPAVRSQHRVERLGYGWLWAGPYKEPLHIVSTEPDTGQPAVESNVPYTAFGQASRSSVPDESEYARPDFDLIAMRLVAVTAIFIAVSLLTGVKRRIASLV